MTTSFLPSLPSSAPMSRPGPPVAYHKAKPLPPPTSAAFPPSSSVSGPQVVDGCIHCRQAGRLSLTQTHTTTRCFWMNPQVLAHSKGTDAARTWWIHHQQDQGINKSQWFTFFQTTRPQSPQPQRSRPRLVESRDVRLIESANRRVHAIQKASQDKMARQQQIEKERKMGEYKQSPMRSIAVAVRPPGGWTSVDPSFGPVAPVADPSRLSSPFDFVVFASSSSSSPPLNCEEDTKQQTSAAMDACARLSKFGGGVHIDLLGRD